MIPYKQLPLADFFSKNKEYPESPYLSTSLRVSVLEITGASFRKMQSAQE